MTAKMPRSYRHVATYDGKSYRRRLRQRRLISNTTRLRTTARAIVFTSVREVRITQAYEGVKHSTYGKLTRENRTPLYSNLTMKLARSKTIANSAALLMWEMEDEYATGSLRDKRSSTPTNRNGRTHWKSKQHSKSTIQISPPNDINLK